MNAGVLGFCLFVLLLIGSGNSSECEHGAVRLIGGSSHLEGRVELCLENNWGTVCDDMWDQAEAQVACRQLGLSDTGAQFFTDAYFGEGTGSVILDNMECKGNESSLFHCLVKNDCEHVEDAGVRCQSNDVVLIHGGQFFPNNSILFLEDLNDNSTRSLSCMSTLSPCCNNTRAGNWFPPVGDSPLSASSSPPQLYQTWTDDQSIQLQIPSEVVSVVDSGLYRCEVPDQNNVIQNLYIGIYTSQSQDDVKISSLIYDSLLQTLICTSTGGPATSVSWTKDGVPLTVDGTVYQQSQVIIDLSLATYKNTLTLVSKEASLSGQYACNVQNQRSSESSQIQLTVCKESNTRFVGGGQTENSRIEVCKNDTWFKLESTFQVESEDGVLQNLAATSEFADSATLTWSSADPSIKRYDITCSNSRLTVMVHMVAGVQSATVSPLVPSSEYQCCVIAHLNRNFENIANYISTTCVSVQLPPETSFLQSNSGSPVLAYSLGGLVGLLLLSILLLAISCVCVMVSKRRTVPKSEEQQPFDISTARNFMVDNHIYKSTCSVGSLGGYENSPIVQTNGGSSKSLDKLDSTVHSLSQPSNVDNVALAANPQYGYTLSPSRHPPHDEYEGPMYELVGTSERRRTTNDASDIKSEPLYNTPSRVPPNQIPQLPIYESTTDVPAAVGKDGLYAKLNH